MRKIAFSAKTLVKVSLSCFADAVSRPNGFSTTTRAPVAQPVVPSSSTTCGNTLGGIDR